MSYYSYTYSAARSYNSKTGEDKESYASQETVNGTVRRNIRAEKIGANQYVLYIKKGDEWVKDTNRGKYYTLVDLKPYLAAKSKKLVQSDEKTQRITSRKTKRQRGG
jgi:hypothetical protein